MPMFFRNHPGGMTDGCALDVGADRQSEQEYDDRHTDAVVETAFEVERPAHDRRYRRVCYDRVAGRRIRERTSLRRPSGFNRGARVNEP